jgi:hypothetical protein
MNNNYILTSIPKRKPRTFIDDASEFLSSAITVPISFLSGGVGSPTTAKPDEVFNGDIDLNEDELLDQDRGEEAEVDDSPDGLRMVRVLCVAPHVKNETLGEKQRLRRSWQVIPLRRSAQRTGNSL